MDIKNNPSTTRYKFYIKRNNQLYSIIGYNYYYQQFRVKTLINILKYNESETIVVIKYKQNDLNNGQLDVFKIIEIKPELNMIINHISNRHVQYIFNKLFKTREKLLFEMLPDINVGQKLKLKNLTYKISSKKVKKDKQGTFIELLINTRESITTDEKILNIIFLKGVRDISNTTLYSLTKPIII